MSVPPRSGAIRWHAILGVLAVLWLLLVNLLYYARVVQVYLLPLLRGS